MPTRNQNESEKDFISRCMSDEQMKNEFEDEAQRFAVCQTKLASEIISFDYDGTLSTDKGKELAKQFIEKGIEVIIITARNSNEDNSDVESTAKKLGINKIVYTNQRDKWSFVQKYKVSTHYDNNKEQVDKINDKTKSKGILFQ
jgi:dihydroxyacetone kinase-like predicted kinase